MDNTQTENEYSGSWVLSQETIDKYLQEKSNQGVSKSAIAKYRSSLQELLEWVKEDQLLTAVMLQAWRTELEAYGYSKITVQKKVTVINDFLRANGHPDLCIPKPIRNDLTGRVFGYLTVIAATEKRHRKNLVWRCICKCGKEVEIPAVMLLGGHTTSCGCLNVETLQYVNRYVEGTSLRQALDNRTVNQNSISGFVGVQPKRDKWTAYINYKGVRYHLGVYFKLEDAVKARARAKEMVMEDATRLFEEYADQYGEMPHRPAPPKKIVSMEAAPSKTVARRNDNTSGCTGVTRHRNKWIASISINGYRYKLGAYEKLEDAVAVRKQAEAYRKDGDIKSLDEMSTNPRLGTDNENAGMSADGRKQ